tara:strand:+ start:13553 stop:14179 length:627 start_codon:yes stop_codon:yes gene_type:complete
MIEQLPFNLTLLDKHRDVLEAKKPWSGAQWNDVNFKENIKPTIRQQLDNNQKVCAYCGLPFKGNKDKQIEHIAAKANYRYPQFTFILQNLVLSCGYCNSLIVKGAKNTLGDPISINYEDCVFLLVHPYFDNPSDHFDWIEDDENDQVLIQIKDNSQKAKFSIEMFDLASQGMSELRSCSSFRKKRQIEMPLPPDQENLLKQALDYIPE